MPPVSLDLAALRHAFAAGLTPDELVEHLFSRLAAIDDPGIFISLRDRAAILADYARLGAYDASKPLWGVPFAIKDNIDVAGLPTTDACPAFAYMPAADAPSVALLRAAGAIAIGKTNLDQFATGLVGMRSPYPAPRNAMDPTLVPGGSSSGSAVAVAHGIVSFALGTDTAGSGRVPAGLNNIVGLKPSLGLISPRGLVPACRTLDTISVFAATVADAFAALQVCAVYDPQEAFSRPIGLAAPAQPKNLRIGVPDAKSRRFFDDHAGPAYEAALGNAAFEGAGIVEIDFAPFDAVAALLYDGPWVAERYHAIRDFIETRPDDLHPVTRAIIGKAQNFTAADAFGGFYRLADLKRETAALWGKIDILVVPTVPANVTRDEIEADPIGPNSRLGTYTNFVNLLDYAALAVPGPFRGDGQPAGITLIGPCGSDGMLAAIGAAFHAAAGVPMGATGLALPPTAAVAPASDGTLPLCVVGAHLSGMPLNAELTRLGGRLMKEVRTAPCYRLFALPGGPPRRPGMLRVPDDKGTAIVTEVWSLPPDGYARFIDKIPAPLCIGTVALADGSFVKGFLCEPEALHGAQDISHYGGWRAFIAATEDANGRH